MIDGEALDPDAATSAERDAIRLARSMDTDTLRRKMREFAAKPEIPPSAIRLMGALWFVYARRVGGESAEGSMTDQEWIAHIDAERATTRRWAEGDWHGYGYDEVEGPMKGRYMLVRWKQPTVAVSHDDPEEAKRLACRLEAALEPRTTPPGSGLPALRVVAALNGADLLMTRAEREVAYELIKEALEADDGA